MIYHFSRWLSFRIGCAHINTGNSKVAFCIPRMFSAIGSSLLLILATSVSTALAQCSLAGYLGAYNTTSGTFIGAVARTLGSQGIFTLDKTGDRSNYLAVIGFTNSTNEGDVVLLQCVLR
ncbi:hypothetical protein B0H14DRAFT_2852372 [Mycena olivaceomarginata]|nr:hypothetical protein B0H14DRAFT_2864822 [Mycena olivaceomarginata]KAJ7813690.1 hypothetical protein B0H14DRAFT_2852372 [Mycena olivaceomarginata]